MVPAFTPALELGAWRRCAASRAGRSVMTATCVLPSTLEGSCLDRPHARKPSTPTSGNLDTPCSHGSCGNNTMIEWLVFVFLRS